MDILVVALIFVCAFSSVIALLNDNNKATIAVLLPIPALGIYSHYLGIPGMFQFVAFLSTCAVALEILLLKQVGSEKQISLFSLLPLVGYVVAVYMCHTITGSGVRQSVLMGSSYYMYVLTFFLLLIQKHDKQVMATVLK